MSAVVVAACWLLCAGSAVAEQPDSHAPRGAHPDWLPAEEWVMERWLPFELERLEHVYGRDRTQLYFFLRDAGDGDRTLLDLARRRGIPTAGLAVRILAPRRAKLSPALWRVLLRRTNAVLGQGHLAEHMLGHVFHHWAIWNHPMRIFGVPRERYLELEGLAPVEIAASGRLTEAQLRGRVLAALDRTARRGVRLGAVPAGEAASMRALLLGAIDRWMRTRPDGGKVPGPIRPLVCPLPT